jgi:hypothetical protein
MAQKSSMRNVLTAVDPTSQGGSLAGTMAPPTNSPLAAPSVAAQPATTGAVRDYEAEDAHEPLSEDDWYQLLHSLGTAMQRANPDIQKVLTQMSPQIDYEGEAAKLKQSIESRKTEKPMSWFQAMSGSVGSPEGARIVAEREGRQHSQEATKQSDLEKLQEDLTMGHISDLQRRGKFQEGLATLLLQKGIGEAGARTRAKERESQERLKGQNAVSTARVRAQTIADTFHFDERLRLKLLDITGKIASAKLQKYGNLDPITGGFTIKPDEYEKWQDETMTEIYHQAAVLRTSGGVPGVPGSTVTPTPGKTPATGHGKAGGKAGDPLGIR